MKNTIMNNKVVHLLLSVVIALGLWMYVITVVSPESEQTYYNVPVVLNNESVLNDKGLMIATEKEPTVTLRLRGNRSDLNNLKNSDITLIADLSKINDAGEQHLSYSISYPGIFADNAFEVLSHAPDKITLQIVEWDTKEVPVNVKFTGTVPPDYIPDKDDTLLDHEKVTITGPKEVVDQIKQAVIDVDLNNQTETISQGYRYTLCDANGVPVDAAQVQTNLAQINVTVRILRVKQVQLVLNVQYGGGATEQNTVIQYSQQIIRIAGTAKQLAAIGDTLPLDTLNLAEILDAETRTYPIDLPDGVENLTGITEVTVAISFPGWKTKELHVSNIELGTPPAGMTVIASPQTLKVTLRVREEIYDAITEEDLKIFVDLSDAVVGEEVYKAEVSVVNPAYTDSVSVVKTDRCVVKIGSGTE